MIGTVRNVGYKFVRPADAAAARDEPPPVRQRATPSSDDIGSTANVGGRAVDALARPSPTRPSARPILALAAEVEARGRRAAAVRPGAGAARLRRTVAHVVASRRRAGSSATPNATATALEIVGRARRPSTALLDAVAASRRCCVWSHGGAAGSSPASTSAASTGSASCTSCAARSTRPPGRRRPLPDGVTVRAFVPGADDDAWLRRQRGRVRRPPRAGPVDAAPTCAPAIAEPWFDPAGFLLAERGRRPARLPLDEGAPGRRRRGVRARRRPRRAGARARPGPAGARAAAPGRARLPVRCCSTSTATTPARCGLYERDGFTAYDLDVQWRPRRLTRRPASAAGSTACQFTWWHLSMPTVT